MMSTTAVSDAAVVQAESQFAPSSTTAATKVVQFAECECCELREECTQGYIERIRERYQGKWICGLCAEAVKDEILRSDRLITAEEALIRHINFCKKFVISAEGPAPDPTMDLIAAMRQILLRSLDSSAIRSLRSAPSSPTRSSVGEGIDRSNLLISRSASLSLSSCDHSSISSFPVIGKSKLEWRKGHNGDDEDDDSATVSHEPKST